MASSLFSMLHYAHTAQVNQGGHGWPFPETQEHSKRIYVWRYTKAPGSTSQSFGNKSPFISIKPSCKHNANFLIGTPGWLQCFGESLRRTLLLCLICDFIAVEDRGRESDWFFSTLA